MSIRTIAKDLGWVVEERPVSVDELGDFAEAGCCGTAAVISPIGTIVYRDHIFNYYDDGRSPGPKTTKLYEMLTGIQAGDIEDKYGWTQEVKMD